MKRIIHLLVIIPFLLGCSDDEKEEDKNVIPTTEFKLSEGCGWSNDFGNNKTHEVNKLYRIDSVEELAPFVNCSVEQVEVDFDNKTLLFVYVLIWNGVADKIGTQLYKDDNTNQLKFDVTLHMLKGPVEDISHLYHIAVLVDKLDKSVATELSIIEKKN